MTPPDTPESGGIDRDGFGPLDRTELQLLLAAWCGKRLTDAQAERLGKLIEYSAEARATYLEYAAVEAELHAAVAGLGGPGVSVGQRAESRGVPLGTPARNHRRFSAAFGERVRTLAPAIAASLVLAMAAVASLQLGRVIGVPGPAPEALAAAEGGVGEAGSAAEAGAADTLTAAVAEVTATRNCRWAEASRRLGFGSELRPGDLVALDSGLAEIRFADGSMVVLEGPSVLRVESLESDDSGVPSCGAAATLLSGRLAATAWRSDCRLPASTQRLGVTLTANETGAGFQYGLASDASRGDELHVFGGAVRAFLINDQSGDSPSRAIDIARHQAARLGPQATTVAKFHADKDQFVRSIAATGGPQDGLYAYEAFDYPGGPLGGQNGGFGWAGPWADIEAACPPGEIATNVVEPGSLRLADAAGNGVRVLGGRAVQAAQQNRIRRALSTSLGGVFDAAGLVENQDSHRLIGANGKTIYLSFLQRVDRVADVFYGVELHRGDGNGNRVLCVGHGADGAGYGVTSNYNAYGKANYGRLGDEDIDTNFLVVKVEFRAQNRDRVTVYRNPESLLDESVCVTDARLRGNFAFDRISLGNFDGTKVHEVDELRIGTTYRAVTGRRDRGGERLVPPLALIHHHQLLARADTAGFVSTGFVSTGFASIGFASIGFDSTRQ